MINHGLFCYFWLPFRPLQLMTLNKDLKAKYFVFHYLETKVDSVNLEIRSRLPAKSKFCSLISYLTQKEFKFECAIYNSKLQWSLIYLLQGGRWGAKSQARVSWPIGKLTTPTHNSGIPKPDGGARSCHNMIRTTMCCHQITILMAHPNSDRLSILFNIK